MTKPHFANKGYTATHRYGRCKYEEVVIMHFSVVIAASVTYTPKIPLLYICHTSGARLVILAYLLPFSQIRSRKPIYKAISINDMKGLQ